MFRFPWGDFHSLNLGWFLQKFNELREDWATAEAGIDGALDAEIQKAEDALTDVFAARDAAAASASAANSSALNVSQSSLASMDARDQSRAARDAAQQAAGNAAASETAAGNSATAAAGSAKAAAGSASQAGQSATNAANSATAAGNSAAAAAESEQNVENIIEEATSEAIASATETATTSATTAAGSATAAGNSATAAAGSATAAGNSATAAAGSAEDAENAASSVEASAQQIATNASDIADLKKSVNDKDIIIPFRVSSEGYYISWSGGETSAAARYSCLDWIDIEGYAAIKYKRIGVTDATSSAGIAFYDSNRTFISGRQVRTYSADFGYLPNLETIEIPNGAKYLRCTIIRDSETYGEFELYGLSQIGWQFVKDKALIAKELTAMIADTRSRVSTFRT